MAKQGYIKLHRQLQECWIWNDDEFSKGQAWIDLLLSCNHEDKKISFDGKPYVVQRGEWLTSILGLSARWKWGRKKVSNFLDVLESDGMIVQNRNNKRTLIKVVNYEVYQGFDSQTGTTEEQQTNNEGTSEEHQRNINNNDKECMNNDNNITTTVVSLFNEICISYPKVKKISDDRKKAVRARLKTYTLEEIEQAFRLAEQSDFMKGANDRNWIADFDWIMKDRNIAKVLEGKYNNRSEQKGNADGTDKGNSTNGNEYDSQMLKTYGL